MVDQSPPPGRNRRPVRIALIVAAVAAVIWIAVFAGQIMSGYKHVKENPEPGQRTPAPAGRPAS